MANAEISEFKSLTKISIPTANTTPEKPMTLPITFLMDSFSSKVKKCASTNAKNGFADRIITPILLGNVISPYGSKVNGIEAFKKPIKLYNRVFSLNSVIFPPLNFTAQNKKKAPIAVL